MFHHQRKCGLHVLVGAVVALTPATAWGQAGDFGGCVSMAAAACVEQIGEGNRTVIDQRRASGSSLATVAIKGDRNGANGLIASKAAILQNSNDRRFTTIRTDSTLESGLLQQAGAGNVAHVSVAGRDNRYHVSQSGDGNSAVQAIVGTANSAAIVQNGLSAPSAANVALQAQAGAGNYAYVEQNGQNNVAVQVQVGARSASLGTALLALDSGRSGALSRAISAEASLQRADAGEGNSVILVQNNAGSVVPNTALLLQAGNDNAIALQQNGGLLGSFASIAQYGDGKSVAINQQAGYFGASPISIVQY